ncbi:Tctex-1, partial [Ramicandelaber brevisporus]
EMTAAAKHAVDVTLQKTATYSHADATEWCTAISECCLKKLTAVTRQRKFVVSVSIVQKNGGGVHSERACFWNSAADLTVTYRHETRAVVVLVSVFAIAI